MIKKALVLIAAIILVALIAYANPIRIAMLLSNADLSLLLLAFLASNLAIILRVMKWKVLLGGSSFRSLVPIQLFGMASSNFTPAKIGEPIKAVVLKASQGRAVSQTLPSIIWERVMDLAVLLILSVGLFFSLSLSGFYYLGIAGLAAASVLIFALVLILKNKGAGNAALKIARKLPVVNKLSENFIKSFYEAKVKRSSLVLCFIFTACSWLLEGVIIFFVFRAIGISLLNPLLLAMIFAIANLIGILSMLPGGLGSTDAALALLLTSFGAEPASAIAGVLISRILSVWYVNFLGAASFVYISRKIDVSFFPNRNS